MLCTNALTQENSIPDNLVLNKPEVLKINGVDKLVFTADDYNIILQMYVAYQAYIELKSHYNWIKDNYETELTICEERVTLKDEAIWVLMDDRDFIYKKIDRSLDEIKKEERRGKIRTILFTTGGTLVGIAGGILIGLFIK